MCVARHWGRRGAHLSKKKSAMIECKKQCLFQRFVMSIVASIRSLRSMDRSFQARSFHLILHPVIPLRDLQLMKLVSTVKSFYFYCYLSQQLSPDGTLTKPANSKLLYGTMSFVRAQIVFSSFQSLSQALTIAIRYSAVRRQGKLKPG